MKRLWVNPIGSDIREGKNTLLRVKAIEFATNKERDFLNYAYGNPDITEKDVKMVQDLTIKTGSLDYSQKLSRKLVEEGKEFIQQITTSEEFKDTLISMADFIITREN